MKKKPAKSVAVPSNVVQVELEIAINATPAKVWKALVDQTTRWWPRDFYTSPKTRGFHFEPKLGGRAYEDFGDGAGVVWFQVFAVDPERSLDCSGCLAVPYGPAHTLLHIELEAQGDSTVLKISDTTIGLVKGDGSDKIDGWRQIFEAGLKTFVETKKPVR